MQKYSVVGKGGGKDGAGGGKGNTYRYTEMGEREEESIGEQKKVQLSPAHNPAV